jgi:hypothetical protein
MEKPILAICKNCGGRFLDYSGKGICAECVK